MARPVLLVALVALCSLSATAEGDILVYLQYPPDFIEEEYRDMPAVFGGSISSDGLRTFMVTGAPRDGCGPLTSPPAPLIPNFTGKWVVLLARYNCSFEVKVRNAQAAGFQGVIVHNVNSSKLEVMSAKNPDGIFIPSVFVSEDTGYMLDANFQYKDGYFLVINGDIPFNINTRLLVPFAIVVGLVFVIMSVFLVVKCVRERRRARRHRLPGSSLKKIPTAKFVKGDPYDICAICLDDYVEGDKLRVLPCSHAYHCKCIDPWLTKNRRVCPVCKRKVFASGERRPAHHSSSDSDTDDDRAPLISSGTGNRTQGGTFTPQSVNPFVLAQQSAPEGPPAAHLHQESEHSSGASTPTRHRGSAAPEAEGVPFLSGVLNLRRSDNGSSEEAPPSTSWCSASSHSGRLLPAPAPSQSPSSQPMIGVAALPNRDFIV